MKKYQICSFCDRGLETTNTIKLNKITLYFCQDCNTEERKNLTVKFYNLYMGN